MKSSFRSSVMSLFCRSSSVVSGEISLGTVFRPGSQCRHRQCEPRPCPRQAQSTGTLTHTDMHPGTLPQTGESSRAGRQKLFSLPIRLQPDNWTPFHTEIRILEPGQGHPICVLIFPHPYHWTDMCPLDRGTQAVPVPPHTPPTTAPRLTQVRALNNPKVAVAAERTHGTEGGCEGVQVRDA